MKGQLLFCNFILASFFSNSQDCGTPVILPSGECNLIRNNIFQHNPLITNTDKLQPFNNGLVFNWLSTHGTPQVPASFSSPAPGPFAGSSHCFMFALSPRDNGQSIDPAWSEGIAQKIPKLQKGKKYGLSFFIALQQYITANYNTVDNLIIYLIKCGDYNLISHNTDPTISPAPPISQKIYCSSGFSSVSWKQEFITFIAEDEFDMIWIYPENNLPNPATQQYGSGVVFSFPELISLKDFNAGPSPKPTASNCTVTIGPLMPNCGFKNARFRWFKPGQAIIQNGGILVSSANQQTTANSSLNSDVGNWTLVMDLPTPSGIANTCSNPGQVTAQVFVPRCPFICAPEISPEGPVDYHKFWENGGEFTLTSNLPNGQQQWNVDGIDVQGATNQVFECTNAINSTANDATHLIKVRNLSNNCESRVFVLNVKNYDVTIYTIGQNYLPVDGTPYHCFSSSNVPVQQFDLGAAATYTWNIKTYPPGGTPTISIVPGSISPNSPLASLNFTPPNASESELKGIANLNGYQKILDYHYRLTPDWASTTYACLNFLQYSIYADPEQTQRLIPGYTGFDREDYQFGPNVIVNYSVNAQNLGNNTYRVYRTNPMTGPFRVTYTAPATIIKSYASNQFNACFTQIINVLQNPGCRTDMSSRTGTGMNETGNFKYWPNPAATELNIDAGEITNWGFEILDITGKRVMKIPAANARVFHLNIREIPGGSYLLKVQGKNAGIYKFIKQ